MIDKLQSPSANKKRKSVATDLLPGQRRRVTKKPKITGDIAGTFAPSPSQSPSKSSFKNSPVTPSSRTAHTPSSKNAKAGSSTKSNATSQSRDLITPTRMSSRVSRPTFKKTASLFEKKSCSPESDGTPPLSIIPPAPAPSLKRKKLTSSPTKRLTGNNTPSKRKWLDPNPIELTSSDDGRVRPPQKRVKYIHKKPLGSQVIDLCSESEDVSPSPRRTRTRTRKEGSVVTILSTDEEADLEIPSFSPLDFREANTRKSPALPPLDDISPPIEDDSLLQASSSAHNAPVPEPKAPVAEEDRVTDENNEVDLPRGTLQSLYNEALARASQNTKNTTDKPSPFSYFKFIPPARTIRYATQSQSPTLHTPLFFERIIRLKARLKPKTLAANPVSDDIGLDSMEISRVNEEQEDAVVELSPVDREAPEVATKTILVPPIDLQDDALSDTQATHILPSILVNDLDVNERAISKHLKSSSPLARHLSPKVVMVEDTPVPESIQAQETSANRMTVTPERSNPSAILPNILCNTSIPSSPAAVDYQIEKAQEDEILEEPSVLKDAHFLVQFAMGRIYDTSNISGSSLLPALELNDTAKFLAAPQTLSESPVRSDSANTLSSRNPSPSTPSCQSSNSSASVESVNCCLVTPDDSPSPFHPPVKALQQPSIRSNPLLPSPIDVLLFDMDLSELNLQTLIGNSKFDVDDDISVSGMELVYPEELF